jgi:dipeptidyl-peptidase-2
MRADIFLAAAILGLTNVSALFHKKGLVNSHSRT